MTIEPDKVPESYWERLMDEMRKLPALPEPPYLPDDALYTEATSTTKDEQ